MARIIIDVSDDYIPQYLIDDLVDEITIIFNVDKITVKPSKQARVWTPTGGWANE
jgi:hypothetical protein